MKTNINYQISQKEFHLFVSKIFFNLVQSKKDEDRNSFNELLLSILPEVKKYIVNRLKRAIKKEKISEGKYKAEGIIDQLFIEVYEKIEEVKQEGDLYLWLFKKTDELLNDILVDEEFDQLFFENIDNYSKPQWDEMEERYSIDGGGDLVLEEDLEDISYNKSNYKLADVFIEENEKDLIDKLDHELSERKISNSIDMILHHLPQLMQSIFELYTNHQFEFEEIAEIKSISTQEVGQLLEDTRRSIKLNFNRKL
ncbi:MAG: sigma-70 family RNA polymerase sigma factor [Flavobacteriales bacterium]|nr:sigma-70 family RNA polymerase sigma factor [Flavobacteriales bacterium]